MAEYMMYNGNACVINKRCLFSVKRFLPCYHGFNSYSKDLMKDRF